MDKIIDLRTIAKYKDPKSVEEAISDEDFKTKFSRMIIQALRMKDEKHRKKALSIIQKNMSDTELKKIELALDYQGYMYDYTGKEYKYMQNSNTLKDRNVKTTKLNKNEDYHNDKGYVIYYPKEDEKPKKEKIIHPQRKREITR